MLVLGYGEYVCDNVMSGMVSIIFIYVLDSQCVAAKLLGPPLTDCDQYPRRGATSLVWQK